MVRFVITASCILLMALLLACDLNGTAGNGPAEPTRTKDTLTDVDSLEPPCTQDTLMVCRCPMTEGKHFRVVRPNGGEQLKVGDIVRVNFCVSPDVGGDDPKYYAETVALSLSVDGGRSWGQIYPLSFGDPHSRIWAVPETIQPDEEEVSTVSDKCLLRVQIYGDLGNPDIDLDISDEPFSIVGP